MGTKVKAIALKDNFQNFLFVLPALIIFSIFYIYPFFEMFNLSLHEWKGIGPKHFIGDRKSTRLNSSH